MKRVFFAAILVFLSLTFFAVNAEAVTGQCSGCHTMHDRQGATLDIGDPGAQGQLLKASCVGCHSGTRDGTGKNSLGAPVVYDDSLPAGQGATNTFAGGDFYWVENVDDAKGHNVFDVSSPDGVIGNTPPGWDPDATIGHAFGQVAGGEVNWTSQLTCAGTYGCHGVRTVANPLLAVATSHHNNADTGGGVSATYANASGTIANSYRFLGGIKGLENATWNWGETPSSHNEYFGRDDVDAERDDDATDIYGFSDTINYFCAQCHGFFHSRIGTAAAPTLGSPWVRHPTDIVLPGGATEYATYNNDGGAGAGDYSLSVPVARGDIPDNATGSTNTVVPGNSNAVDGAIVMCLSCHRAHGSPEDDALRFDYTTMLVGSGPGTNNTGCFVCHTAKN